LGGRAAEDAVGAAAERVRGVAVGEGEGVAGVQVFFVLAVVPRRLGEAVVEEAQAAAGDVGHEAVEDLPARLVGVETEIEEVAQEPPALRDAEAVGAGDDRPAVGASQWVALTGVVPQEGNQVSDGGVAESLDDRPLGFADQLVEVTGPESTGDAEPVDS